MSKKLKILFISSSSGSLGGGELYLIFLGRALVQRGHEVVLWVSTHERMDDLCQQFQEIGEVVREPYTNTYDYRIRSLQHFKDVVLPPKKLAASIERIQPDVIHMNKQNLEDGLDLLGALKHVNIPSIAFLHMTQSAVYLKAQYAPPRDWVSHFFLSRYTAPLVTHSNRLEELKTFLNRTENILSIDNGVSLPTSEAYAAQRRIGREELGLDEDTFLIVGVGRLETQKRPDRFREMAHALQQKAGNSRVIWVGAGRLENEWDQWLSENNVEPKSFARLGWKRNVFPYLAAADIYLHPAGYEGMPFSLLEAMAWNNCCIMMDELASELAYFDEGKAIIAQEGDSTWLDKARNPEHRQKLAANSRALVEAQFSVEKMAEEYEALYLKVTQ